MWSCGFGSQPMENGQKMGLKNMILGRFLPPLQLAITQSFVKVGGWCFHLNNMISSLVRGIGGPLTEI